MGWQIQDENGLRNELVVTPYIQYADENKDVGWWPHAELNSFL